MAIEILSDGTLYANNKLGMVNQCLLAIGEIPLAEGTVLDNLQPGTDGAIARDIVAKTMLNVQSRGWFFNTDRDYRLYPDNDGFISVPPNLLRLDTGRYEGRQQYILRGNRVYDMVNQSYMFTGYIETDVVWSESYESLPLNAYSYIALRSARQFQETVVGSGDLYTYTVNAEQEALGNFQREQLQYSDYNMIPGRVSGRYNPNWGLDNGFYNRY